MLQSAPRRPEQKAYMTPLLQGPGSVPPDDVQFAVPSCGLPMTFHGQRSTYFQDDAVEAPFAI